jgi:hypothetical protein
VAADARRRKPQLPEPTGRRVDGRASGYPHKAPSVASTGGCGPPRPTMGLRRFGPPRNQREHPDCPQLGHQPSGLVGADRLDPHQHCANHAAKSDRRNILENPSSRPVLLDVPNCGLAPSGLSLPTPQDISPRFACGGRRGERFPQTSPARTRPGNRPRGAASARTQACERRPCCRPQRSRASGTKAASGAARAGASGALLRDAIARAHRDRQDAR